MLCLVLMPLRLLAVRVSLSLFLVLVFFFFVVYFIPSNFLFTFYSLWFTFFSPLLSFAVFFGAGGAGFLFSLSF